MFRLVTKKRNLMLSIARYEVVIHHFLGYIDPPAPGTLLSSFILSGNNQDLPSYSCPVRFPITSHMLVDIMTQNTLAALVFVGHFAVQTGSGDFSLSASTTIITCSPAHMDEMASCEAMMRNTDAKLVTLTVSPFSTGTELVPGKQFPDEFPNSRELSTAPPRTIPYLSKNQRL